MAVLVREDFEKWLASQPMGKTFKSSSAAYCPIATFLSESKGCGNVAVDAGHVNCNGIQELTPEWAKRFISKFDGAYHNGVTAREALATLTVIGIR